MNLFHVLGNKIIFCQTSRCVMLLLYTGHLEKCGKNWKKSVILFQRSVIFAKKRKSAILAQKWEITDFGQIVHNNAILLKKCHIGAIFAQKCGITPSHFSRCPVYNSVLYSCMQGNYTLWSPIKATYREWL